MFIFILLFTTLLNITNSHILKYKHIIWWILYIIIVCIHCLLNCYFILQFGLTLKKQYDAIAEFEPSIVEMIESSMMKSVKSMQIVSLCATILSTIYLAILLIMYRFHHSLQININILKYYSLFWSISLFLFCLNFARNREFIKEKYLIIKHYFIKIKPKHTKQNLNDTIHKKHMQINTPSEPDECNPIKYDIDTSNNHKIEIEIETPVPEINSGNTNVSTQMFSELIEDLKIPQTSGQTSDSVPVTPNTTLTTSYSAGTKTNKLIIPRINSLHKSLTTGDRVNKNITSKYSFTGITESTATFRSHLFKHSNTAHSDVVNKQKRKRKSDKLCKSRSLTDKHSDRSYKNRSYSSRSKTKAMEILGIGSSLHSIDTERSDITLVYEEEFKTDMALISEDYEDNVEESDINIEELLEYKNEVAILLEDEQNELEQSPEILFENDKMTKLYHKMKYKTPRYKLQKSASGHVGTVDNALKRVSVEYDAYDHRSSSDVVRNEKLKKELYEIEKMNQEMNMNRNAENEEEKHMNDMTNLMYLMVQQGLYTSKNFNSIKQISRYKNGNTFYE
eukprot:242102_1